MTSDRVRVLIALGSNIDPGCQIPEAVRALERHTAIDVLGVSRIFDTEAVGKSLGQPRFHNAAVLAETALSPAELKRELRVLESDQGRVRGANKYAPRTIDLDISFYADLETELDGTPIPDPDVGRHLHLAQPLADVAPDWVEPRSGLTLQDLVLKLSGAASEVGVVATRLVPLETGGRYAVELEGRPNEVYAPRFEALVREMLHQVGEDPARDGLARTPLRVAKAMDFLTSGYTTTLDEVVNDAIFDEGFDEMVVVKDIEYYSLCEHHLLPFFGTAAVGYLPAGRIIGLSKIARIVDLYARRLQVQERLTNQVADAMMEVLSPHGVAVVMEGSHFCMMMRGVQKQGGSMVTSAMRGSFNDNPRTRSEFLELIKD